MEGPHQPVHRVQAAVAGQVLDPKEGQDDVGSLLRPQPELLQDRGPVHGQVAHLRHQQQEGQEEGLQRTL